MTQLHHNWPKSKPKFGGVLKTMSKSRQAGIVLFLALIALVVMSLAAVALIRSVDTSTLIAGNLSFKEAATTSADTGIEAAIALLTAMRDDPANTGKIIATDTTHTFNITNTAIRPGYHSNANPALDLLADATWAAAGNAVRITWTTAGLVKNDGTGSVNEDSSGNSIQYIIQRMCRNANVATKDADCLYSKASEDKDGQEIKLPQNICSGPGCPAAGQTPQIRITVRTTGPKNTLSYVQAFVY